MHRARRSLLPNVSRTFLVCFALNVLAYIVQLRPKTKMRRVFDFTENPGTFEESRSLRDGVAMVLSLTIHFGRDPCLAVSCCTIKVARVLDDPSHSRTFI